MPADTSRPFVILTTAVAGLGHLRVTRALRDALPAKVSSIEIPAKDTWLTMFHNVMSNNSLLRKIFEYTQDTPQLEDAFTWITRQGLHLTSSRVRRLIVDTVRESKKNPTSVVIACSHFMLAESVGVEKQAIEAELGIPVRLVVQITDDTTQHIWYVTGADLLVAPSVHVASSLHAYGVAHHMADTPISVLPYPINPLFSKPLNPGPHERLAEYEGKAPLKLVIPVSGAAAGLSYLTDLAIHISNSHDAIHTTIVGQATPRLKSTRRQLLRAKNIKCICAKSEDDVITAYENYYKENVVGAEVTKPSEQAFKVLARHDQVGGSILFLTHPVGRQEYENLEFLFRNRFIPTPSERRELFALARYHQTPSTAIRRQARYWRGLQLPPIPKEAASFIHWCLETKLLADMGLVTRKAPSLQPDGAKEFWDIALN